MIFAAILAGGVGRRMECHAIPKQFIMLSGKPIIVRTLEVFAANPRFDGIYIAVHHDWIDHMRNLLTAHFPADFAARVSLVEGGQERLDSFVNVMNAVIAEHGLRKGDVLICHDSVRPFVRPQMIDDCIDATLADGLALTVVPTEDTIHIASAGSYIDGTLDRRGLYNGQNPSGFNIALLQRVLERATEAEKRQVTGTTQLMLRAGYKLRVVQGHTSNFKITTDNDLDVAERMLRGPQSHRLVSLLDCTLRDGGIAIDFNFGIERMHAIRRTLEDSGVEMIECGYIDQRKGTPVGRTCFDSEVSIQQTLLGEGKKPGVKYVAMIDYGTFDVNCLQPRVAGGIDGIRLAFHKEHWRESIEWGKIILSKGYELYVQPMVTLRYSDEEFALLMTACNEQLPGASGFYIVDSFGQMDAMALTHMLEMADASLREGMVLGFHAHNNRQLAFSNALTFLNFNMRHDAMLDASVMGMGKGAGNLCTELIIPVLNERGKEYHIEGIYDAISEYFTPTMAEHHWGYSLDYYLSSVYSCTPSYIRIFLKDPRVTTDVLVELLKTIPEDKRAACDRLFAEHHVERYFEEH